MPLENLDTSYPRRSVEARIGIKHGTVSLDALAQWVSIHNPDEPVSVRDNEARPVTHSRVFLAGEPTDAVPYLARFGPAEGKPRG